MIIKKGHLKELGNYVVSQLQCAGCNNTLYFTEKWLVQHPQCDAPSVLKLLQENGGFCDCEVLFNAMDRLVEDDNPSTRKHHKQHTVDANHRTAVQLPLLSIQTLNDLTDVEFMTDDQWEAAFEEEWREEREIIINGPFLVDFEALAYGQVTVLACKQRRGVTLGWQPRIRLSD